MSVYNARNEDEFDKAIESILRQQGVELELIIYDDGSDEAGRKLLSRVLKWDEENCISYRDYRVRLISSDEHRGIARGLNSCIDIANGRFIARMDADDISKPDRLMIEAGELDVNHDIDFVGCGAYLFDDKGIYGKRMLPTHPAIDDYLKFSPYIHPTVMFRRELFDQYRYDESVVTAQCEDYELFLKLYEHGIKGMNIPECLYEYREDTDSYHRRTLKRRIREVRVRYRYFGHMHGVSTVKKAGAILRPLAGAVLPDRLIGHIKKRESTYAG